jgi:eukaryotic-like serine/threonine-protein kinase
VGTTTASAAGQGPAVPVGSIGSGLSGSALAHPLTMTGAVMGTPYYMAPEQFLGEVATARADQFSFCVALYQALYGAAPFAGSTFEDLRGAVLRGDLQPPPKGAKIPARLRRILLRGLSSDPTKRHASMNQLLLELGRDPRRRAGWIAAAVAATAGVVATVAVLSRHGDVASQCAAGAERVESLWNPAQQARMASSFLATKQPYAAASLQRATASIEQWQQRWRGGYIDACEDTRVRGTQSELLLDRRLLCLERHLADASATVELLVAGGGDAVERAVEATSGLPSVAVCADPSALLVAVAPPETPVAQRAVAEVRKQLDQAQGLRRVARFVSGLTRARAALAAAIATQYRPVQAEALLVLGQFLSDTANHEAEATLRRAMHVAAQVDDQPLLVASSSWLISAMARNSVPYLHTIEVAELAEAIAQHSRPSVEDRVRLIDAIGVAHHVHGHEAPARARLEEALALAERQLGPDHTLAMTVLTDLATVARAEGRYADAQRLLERVVSTRERLLGKDHPDVADSLNSLGHIYRTQGKLDEAKALYDRSRAILTEAFGVAHPRLANAYTSLGAYYTDLGDGAAAVDAYGKALAIKEKELGPNHADVGQALSNLAMAEESVGHLDRARELGERSLRILEGVFGTDHALIAITASNLGLVAHDQGRGDEAVRWFDRALQITERIHGPDHPDVADYLENTAAILQEQGKLAEAAARYTRSLEVVTKVFGADHARTGTGLVNLSNIRLQQHDDVQALELAERGLKIFDAKLPATHPNRAYAHLAVGQALLAQHQAAEALPHMQQALAIREAAKLPPVFIAEARFFLAKALYASGSTTAALAAAKRALSECADSGNAAMISELRAWLAKPS